MTGARLLGIVLLGAVVLVLAGPAVGCSPGPAPGGSTSSAASSTTSANSRRTATLPATPGGEMACGSIPADDGRQVPVVAAATAAGTTGCTEAIAVLSDYFRRAPVDGEGAARTVTLQGWRCSTTGAGAAVTTCEKQGLAVRAGP